MASTIKWFYDNGGSDGSPGANNDLSAGGTLIRWKTADDGTSIDSGDPIPVPTSGTNYSYWCHFYMKMTARPGTEVVNNMKFYTDGGGYGTGITLSVGDQNPGNTAAAPASGYELATGTQGSTGDEMVAGHSVITTKQSAFGYTSASPRAMNISEASTQLDAVGEMTDYIVLQLDVASTATPSTLTAETLTGRYDEA